MNLGSLASVRSFVEMFYQKHPNGLHFLINDAGIGTVQGLCGFFRLGGRLNGWWHFMTKMFAKSKGQVAGRLIIERWKGKGIPQ